MNTPISAQDKKSFIQWFLKNYQLKKRESVWILNYILNHQQVLNKVHFVRDVKFCPRGIVITSQCSSEVPFRFYKDHLVTTDAEKTFHDIRMNQDENLYIQLNFSKSHQHSYYASVTEENPFVPDDYFVTKKDRLLAKKLLDKTVFEYKKKILQQKIDHALDELDQERFIKLSNELNKLEEMFNDQPKLQKQ
ncbi:ReoY family proteolytic degradation factor [Oceanobacillus sp. Castelsardo]|uniref:ReoY family proteolytic degradation factor n=1 Tax=Oceanobacillus sp. Castelsardo TaxID=1851204 RepID=UPI000838A7E6|nr:ReoY family proteolytic degradation factor [Oceanobacillus sp. Castelsardo]